MLRKHQKQSNPRHHLTGNPTEAGYLSGFVLMCLSFLRVGIVQFCVMTDSARVKFQSLESLTQFIKTVGLESFYIDTRTLVVRAPLSESDLSVAKNCFGADVVSRMCGQTRCT